MILTGSQAILHHFPDYTGITDKSDIDYIVFSPMKSDMFGVEYLYADCHKIIQEYCSDNILTPDLLYTIKVSHLSWEGKNSKWVKHLRDVQFLKNKGCKLIEPVYNSFYFEWEKRFGSKSHIKLNVSADEFFNSNVTRKYNHDFLHEYYKVLDEPIYKKMLKDGSDVMASIDKFQKLPYNIQLLSCLEEMFVISDERNISLFEAYKKLVTTMTRGYWNRFIIENSSEILDEFHELKNEYKVKRRKLHGL